MCLTPKTQLETEMTISELKLDNADLVDNCDYVDWDQIDILNNKINNKLKVVQLNICGIKGKYFDLPDLINKLNNPDVIILCEMWLKANDSQPQIAEYNFIGQSRQNRKGGGVGFLINKRLKSTNLPELKLKDETVKSLFIKIKGNHQNMVMELFIIPLTLL